MTKFRTMKKRVILSAPMERYQNRMWNIISKYYNEYDYKSYLRPDEDVDTSKICPLIKSIYTVWLELHLTELLERRNKSTLPIIALQVY